MSITLKAARVNKGYTLDTASELIGVSKQTLSKWENGKTFPDVPNIKRIEIAYDVAYSDIIFLPTESN